MPGSAFRPGSLGSRLLTGASLRLIAALAVSYVVLTDLFRETVSRNFDIVLMDHVDELLMLLDVGDDGAVALSRHPVDPRFVKPDSGWYWSIAAANGRTVTSGSLGINRMPATTDVPANSTVDPYHVRDHAGRTIRVIGKRLRPQGADADLTIRLSGPAVVIDDAVAQFNGALMLALAGIGLALIAAVVFQVYVGLRPLRIIGQSLAAIRTGQATRLEGGFPEEVAPLATEVNALLNHNERSLAHTRNRVDDLAHALKTPIAALTNAAEAIEGTDGQAIRDQVAAMAKSVEHHLSRARIAGTGDVIGARTSLRPLVEGLHRTVSQIYADKNLEFDIDLVGDPVFRGESQDLAEMLGNLLDNTCKWADRRIQFSGRANGDELVIEVGDDGPGIAEVDRDEAMGRGGRLDDATPGDGFGLPIVRDIAEHYQGTLELARSPAGGVAATLRLPAA
ncbi:MAG: HAMP domain-containing sensor histidine kinase [Rhodospirillaceae bacterium]